MTTKTDTTTLPPGASPDTVAWRLGQLESQVKEVRKDLIGVSNTLMQKLDGIAAGFITQKELEAVKEQAYTEHEAINKRISAIEARIKSMKDRDWVRSTLSAILGVVLTVLVGYFIHGVVS